MKVSELIKIIKRNKCHLVEHGAKHDKWHSDITNNDFMIPRHRSKELSNGTLNSILKQAGIKEV